MCDTKLEAALNIWFQTVFLIWELYDVSGSRDEVITGTQLPSKESLLKARRKEDTYLFLERVRIREELHLA